MQDYADDQRYDPIEELERLVRATAVEMHLFRQRFIFSGLLGVPLLLILFAFGIILGFTNFHFLVIVGGLVAMCGLDWMHYRSIRNAHFAARVAYQQFTSPNPEPTSFSYA